MNQSALIIAVILLSTFAGCRSVPPTSISESAATTRAGGNLGAGEEPQRGISTTVFVQQSVDRGRSVVPVGQAERSATESLPDPNLPLTLAALEEVAVRQNPTVAAASARLEVARGRRFQAGRYPNPVVGYHATEIGNRGTAGQQGGFISQQFITAGKLNLDQSIAARELDEAHFRFQAQLQRVLNDVRIRFYDALVAQQRVELTEKLAGTGDDLVEATRKLLGGRRVTENDLLQAQIKADESHILLDNARNQHIESWRRLAAVIGLPNLETRPLSGRLDRDLPALEWDDAYAMVQSDNPELGAARTRVERACLALERSKREPIPNLEVSVSHRHHNVTEDEVTNVQVAIPIPVFNKNQGNIRSAQAEWMSANSEVERIELDILNRLAVAYRRYANARQQVDRYSKRMVPKAEESLELVRGGYEQGRVEYLTLLTAQQTYLQVNLSYIDSLRELRAAAAEIEGQLLTDSLAQNR